MKTVLFTRMAAAMALLICSTTFSQTITWQVQSDYFGARDIQSQIRSMRGIALAKDGSGTLFLGYIQGSSTSAVRKVKSAIHSTLGADAAIIGNYVSGPPTNPGYTGTVGTNPAYTGGGLNALSATLANNSRTFRNLATDERGNVYAPDGAASSNPLVRVFNNGLNTQISSFSMTASGNGRGIKVLRVNNNYYCYVAASSGIIERWNVTDPTTPTLDLTWGKTTSGANANGRIDIKSVSGWGTAYALGIAVDADGTLYIAGGFNTIDATNSRVFKINNNGDLSSSPLQAVVGFAYDLAIFKNKIYVVQYNANSSAVAVRNKSDLSAAGSLTTGMIRSISTLPAAEITDNGYSGIDVDPQGHLYVVDQIYKYFASTTIAANAYTPPSTSFNPSPTAILSTRIYFDRVLVSSPVEPDTDGDSIFDVDDNCPLAANPGQEDLDHDGIGDVCDNDIDGDGVVNNNDCAPANPSIFQSATLYADNDNDNYTVGNGIVMCYGASVPAGYKAIKSAADDCNDNDPAVYQIVTWYQDQDNDGHAGAATQSCDRPVGTNWSTNVIPIGDCNDNDPAVYQEATWYQDIDADGHAGMSTQSCSMPAGTGWSINTIPVGDCNDNDPTVYQEAIWYQDQDGDGHAGMSTQSCSMPAGTGWSTNTIPVGDCNDNDPTVYQEATWYQDIDADGHAGMSTQSCSMPAGTGWSTNAITVGDCNDNDPAVYQEATWYQDVDGDGHAGATTQSCSMPAGTGWSTTQIPIGDCDDSNPAVYQSSILFTDADNDTYTVGNGTLICYGASIPTGYQATMSLVEDCNDNDPSVYQVATWYQDQDGDGHAGTKMQSCSMPAGTGWSTTQIPVGDCNDNDNSVHQVTTWYQDQDGDGHAGTTTQSCSRPAGTGWSITQIAVGDCNDNDPAVYQVATWYQDQDGDGHAGTTTQSCSRPAGIGWSTTQIAIGDCNDNNPAVFAVQTWYQDKDGDGHAGTSTPSCNMPAGTGWTTSQLPVDDCNDNDASWWIAPTVQITASSPDFCSSITLTATSQPGVTYCWKYVPTSTTVGTSNTYILTSVNSSGTYKIIVTSPNGCKASDMYSYNPQNNLSNFTILGTKDVNLGQNNTINGSVGNSGSGKKVAINKNSAVNGFVRASIIALTAPVSVSGGLLYTAANVALPPVQINNAVVPTANFTVPDNAINVTINNNYNNLVIGKKTSVTVTGNIYGKITIREGAVVTFTAGTLDINEFYMEPGKASPLIYTQATFKGTAIRVKNKVTVGDRGRINNYNGSNPVFYMNDPAPDIEKFTVNGNDTKVTCSIFMPKGKLNINHSSGPCIMTGKFLCQDIVSQNNVTWNSANCTPVAPAAPLITAKEVRVSPVNEQPFAIEVYPNPSTSAFSLRTTGFEIERATIRITDAAGKAVSATSVMGSLTTFGRDLKAGVYFAEVIMGKDRKLLKLIKL